MADIVLLRDVGALGALLRLSAAAAATAGGTGNATTTTGATIDRFGFQGGSLPGVVNPAVVFDATLQSGKTLSIGYAVQDSADGVAFADYATGTSTQVAVGPNGGGAVAGQLDIGSINLSSARRYVRLNSAPSLSATGTDTAITRAVGFFAGFDRVAQ